MSDRPDNPSAVRMADLTTFRLGGPAGRFVDCATPEELISAVRAADGVFRLIGGGSNLLVSDAGLEGLVIRYRSETPQIAIEGDEVVVSGATLLDDLAAWSVEEGLDGLVMCSGIPGTVGGAVAGNAGAFGEQIGDRTVSVALLLLNGTCEIMPAAGLGFAYRRSALQQPGAPAILSVRLALPRGDRAALRARREEILALRAAKHPDWRRVATAGSFFKNVEPTSVAGRRQAAGWFLEQAGALAMRVGGAHPFEKHANIVVCDPGGTAQDVLDLSQRMAAAVRETFGLALKREVRVLGPFRDGEAPA
jgi:UDP-N-acetylmuramate dehydrogenase